MTSPPASTRTLHGYADYTLENPANGKLWALPAVRACLAREDRTSYCKYGTIYSKPTKIAHTFGNHLTLRAPCCKADPCDARRERGRHAADLTAVPRKAERNSLPRDLVRSMMSACEASARAHDARAILFVDVFAGWGSVCSVVEEVATLPTYAYTNDVSRAMGCSLDVDVGRFGLEFVLHMALVNMRTWMDSHASSAIRCASEDLAPVEGDTCYERLRRARVHLWVHLSVPCTTYSTMGGGTHRAKGSLEPKTALGRAHDRMVAEMLPALDKLVTRTG